METCQVNEWDSSMHCHNPLGKHTLTFLPLHTAYTALKSENIENFTDTVQICDECYNLLGNDGWGILVNGRTEIKDANHIFVD